MKSILLNPRFYCPIILDLPAKLVEHGEQQWIARDIWRLYYILTVIYRKRWEKEFDSGTYVELNTAVLQQVLHSKKTKPALDVLIKIGAIETNNYYRVKCSQRGGKSKGYRFTDSYNHVKFREVKEIDYSTISK